MKAAAAFRAAALAATALCAGCTSINLAPGTLAGTSWRVASVNGSATPTASEYSVRLEPNGGFGARFGCNHMGGSYRLAGATLEVGNLHQTLMGCPEPAARFETLGSAILMQPMQVSFSSKQRMTLSNESGTIALDRIPGD